jgi:hypothetical protein
LAAVVIADGDVVEAGGVGQRDELVLLVEVASACQGLGRGRGAA